MWKPLKFGRIFDSLVKMCIFDAILPHEASLWQANGRVQKIPGSPQNVSRYGSGAGIVAIREDYVAFREDKVAIREYNVAIREDNVANWEDYVPNRRVMHI